MWDVFISHASEDKDGVARPLAELLRDRGLSVWLDEEVLRLGESLRRSLDEGLARSRYGVVILSRHSLDKHWPQRELDGLIAREEAGDTVVLPVWHGIDHATLRARFPSLADRIAIGTHEGLEAVADRIVASIEGSGPVARAPARSRAPVGSDAIDFSDYIADKTRTFTGRGFLFRKLDDFLDAAPSGYFLLLGDPGIGKTTFLARLVVERGYPHHFNIAAEGLTSTEAFVRNATTRIVQAHALDPRFLPRPDNLGAGVLKGALREAGTKDERVVLVVDALDEADPPAERANPLGLPRSLASGVYVIASTRRGRGELEAEHAHVYELDASSQANLDDVRHAIEAYLERPAMVRRLETLGVAADAFTASVLERSEGNFMYVRHALPAIESGVLAPSDVADLPQGLRAFYRRHWEQMRGRDRDTFVRVNQPIIAVLATSRRPVSARMVAEVTGLPVGEVQWALQEWSPFLQRVESDGTVQYRLYHGSYRDFLERQVAG